ncbi:hypothetical protein IAE35_18220 [Pseudomonas sp. S75]|uniref:dermonecrotic toxin domain-containing protein n=1 Tax=unclassified Pseudomonas TaxID=196821 RepID=UPI0019051DC0|nr:MULTISPECIES: DUF6543 domain-containing protein [unclassified Pseudomonas]MBJ9977715.1 hypothetical protein [Pseudomonas sp. S30]MBK0155282.1 hypothetical protein [Pseudomonas sp. S75]
MTSPDRPAARVAHLPDGLPEIANLPSLSQAARALFEARLPGVLALELYLLTLAPEDGLGQRQVLEARPLTRVLEGVRRGQPVPSHAFEPERGALSVRAEVLQAPPAAMALTLSRLREVLNGIAPMQVQARLLQDALAYWEVPPSLSEDSRRLTMQRQIRQSLRSALTSFSAAGWLAMSTRTMVEDIVAHPRLIDRSIRRGVYAVIARAAGGGQDIVLPGVVALSTEPAGFSPAHTGVTERQTLTGPCVLYCTGYFGFVNAYAHLQQALTWLATALGGQGPWLQTLLRRLGPAAQAQLMQERTRPDGRFEVFARPIDDNFFEVLAEQQIAAWRDSAQTDETSLWDSRLGLDVSVARTQRIVQAFMDHRLALRARLPLGLRELSQARQADLDRLIAALFEQRRSAARFWAALPSFDTFARERIAAALALDGIQADPAAIGVTITVTEFSAEQVGSELAPGVDPDRGHAQTRVIDCTLLEYLAMRMEARADAHWQVELHPSGESLPPRLTLSYLKTLGQRLNLPQRYAQKIADTTQRARAGEREAALGQIETQLRLDALLANACGALDDSGHALVVDALAAAGHRQPSTRVEGLTIAGNSVRDVLIFSRAGESSIVCYLPGHPTGQPFKRWHSRSGLFSLMQQDLHGMDPTVTWTAAVRYWLQRFGKHQHASVFPALRHIAEGKGGERIATVLIGKPLALQLFDYRLAFLSAEADSLALSDAELALERGLDIAVMVFRLVSAVIPARLMTVLDLAELGYYLFSGYAAYAQGQKEQAGDYVLEALSSVSGLANARLPRLRWGAPAQVPMRLRSVAAGLSLEPLPTTTPSAGLRRIESGIRKGLFVADDGLHVMLDGRSYRVYEVLDPLQGTSRFYLGEGEHALARSLFSNPDTRVHREPGGHRWRIVPRLGLRGGMELSTVGRGAAPGHLRGVRSSEVRGSVEHRIDDGVRSQVVYFDLDVCCWYSPEHRLFYEYDAGAGHHRAVSPSARLPSEVQRQLARYELECVERPMLPTLKTAVTGEPLPKEIHQVWIGEVDALIGAHDTAIKANAAMARQSGYGLKVHFLGTGGRLRTLAQLSRLRLRYREVTFVGLAAQTSFNAFRRSAQGQVFDYFLQPPHRNHAAASDVLRYHLLFEHGGLYLDVDDRLLKPLPDFHLRPGQLAVGAIVENYLLTLKGPNNSHFASLAGNPLLDAMQMEVVRRFAQHGLPDQRPLFDQPGFSAYMREISRLTGPGMFNDVRHLADAEVRAVDGARGYVFDLIGQGVLAEREVMHWLDAAEALYPTLEAFIDVGNAHSWRTTRR